MRVPEGVDDEETGMNDEDEYWNRPRAGDGRRLEPFRPSTGLTRTRFELRLGAAALTVDVDHDSERAALYLDGARVSEGEMPVRFVGDGGAIEVSASLYGMRRVHLVRPDGSEQRLTPASGTPEHWRAGLARRHPTLSRAIAATAVTVLVVDLLLLAPQLLELVTHLDVWPDVLPMFTSPISLPSWVNTTLTVLGVGAGVERALTFRRNRLLDAETALFDDD